MADRANPDGTAGCVMHPTADNNAKGDRLSRRTLAQLAKPLDPECVSERLSSDGRALQYLEGWAAISQANRIFWYGGWGAEVIGNVTYVPLRLAHRGNRQSGPTGMYTATVQVVVRGCAPRSDVGCCSVDSETLEAHEAAYKGAVTDALKRVLRHFGNQFGNGLYDRRGLDSDAPSTPSPIRSETLRKRIVELSARLGVQEERARDWVEKRYERPWDEVAEEELADAVRCLAERLNQRSTGRARAA